MFIFVHILIHVLIRMSRYIISFTILGPIFFIYMLTYCSSPSFSHFDALSLLGLFCFVCGILITLVDRLWIHDTWKIGFQQRLENAINYK